MPHTVSKTAQLVAAVRAGHLKHQGGILFEDPWAAQFLSWPWSVIVRHRPLYRWVSGRLLRQVLPVHTQILLRARHTQELVREAAARGVRQYLLLGAGYDSFALIHAQSHPELRVFELDHPLTQADKLRRLQRVAPARPAQLRFVPFDLEAAGLREALLEQGFDPQQATIVSWLGTTYYLSDKAICQTLRSLRPLLAPGSQCLVDHGLSDSVLDAQTRAEYARLRRFVALRGEPMRSRFAPDVWAALVHSCGFRVSQHWSPTEMQALYLRHVHLPYSRFSQFALLEPR